MRVWVGLFAAAAMHAGVVRGVVVEHASGLPLARSVVRLTPIPNAPGRPFTMRASTSGAFTFSGVPDGLYLLIATREGFFPAAYGQRRPEGQGTPVEVTQDSDLFTDLRMYRKGAITGRVLDENGVGMEGFPVIAYRARLPLRSDGRAISDDRGVYRIHGLAPGKYWVRSVAQTLDDGSGRLPMFGREAPETKDAFTYRVKLDEETPYADVRPAPGNLFHLRGVVQCLLPDPPFTVTLSSETMRRTTQTPCMGTYSFEGLAPGVYQVLATRPDFAGYLELSIDHDTDSGNVQPIDLPRVDYYAVRAGAGTMPNFSMKIFGRRQDLSDEGKMEELKPRMAMFPGHWEMMATVGPDYYVESMGNDFSARRPVAQLHAPDAFDVFVEMRQTARVRVTISDQAAHLEGSVTREGKSVAGTPVFLWPVTDAARRSLGGFRQILSDVAGKFRFDGLPPGDYRILASFDLSEVDEEALEEARAMSVTMEASRTSTVDVPLWIAP